MRWLVEYICGRCKHYTGTGDWKLRCSKPHSAIESPFGFMCYEHSPACEQFEPIDEEERNYESVTFEEIVGKNDISG